MTPPLSGLFGTRSSPCFERGGGVAATSPRPTLRPSLSTFSGPGPAGRTALMMSTVTSAMIKSKPRMIPPWTSHLAAAVLLLLLAHDARLHARQASRRSFLLSRALLLNWWTLGS